MRAVKKVLIPKICDILRDFLTSPEDEAFMPLLRQLVKATVADTTQAIDDKHLDLLNHVVTHCTSSSPTDPSEITSITRPILRILMKHRCRLATETHSRMQRDIDSMAMRRDMERLRVIYAEMLLFEAQAEEGQNDQ
ncbi:unnamed protein product [Aureobasidium uvarum]|uniref:Uncharacterized protein n=1 Tax=Aureobasidium uvarum TaxID=2773716 RepID=A0A9N8PNT3_9PEZI|nr:unnamed protein product [Aureobasidium uvarum]